MAYYFDGSNDYVTFGYPGPSAFQGVQFTVAVWFYKTGTGVTASSGTGGVVGMPTFCYGVGEADGNNKDLHWFCAVRTAGADVLVGDFEDSGGSPNNNAVTCATTISDNQWMHSCLTFDGTTLRMYLDGVEDGTYATTETPRNDSIQGVSLGTTVKSTGSRTGAWQGYLTEAYFWDNDLTASDVSLLVNSRIKGIGQQIQPGSLLSYMPMDEFNDGSTASGAGTCINRITPSASGTPSGCLGFAENFLSYY